MDDELLTNGFRVPGPLSAASDTAASADAVPSLSLPKWRRSTTTPDIGLSGFDTSGHKWSSDDTERSEIAQKKSHHDDRANPQIPRSFPALFPTFCAENEATTSWVVPHVRSALYNSSDILAPSVPMRRNANDKGIRSRYSSYTTIDWLNDDIREQARLRGMRAISGSKGWWLNHVWDPIQGWLLVVVVGTLCGLFAGFISEWTELLAGWKSGYCQANWQLSQTACCRQSAVECEYWHEWGDSHALSGKTIFILVGSIYTILAAAMAVRSATRITINNHGVSSSVESSVSPTVKMAYYGAGSGIPEVKSILAGFVIHGFLGVRILIVKTLGLIMCCASGIMAGKEGPMVQIASSLGNISTRIFDKYYKNESKKREIISAAAAAGVSVAFGAPIGGVLFSLEEVSYFFPNKTMLRSLTCALVAALVLKVYDPFGTGKLVLFQTTYDMDYHWFEMVAFVIIGVFGGLYGAAFCRLNMAINRLRKNTRIGHYPIIEVATITSLTLALSYGNPFTRVGLGELVGSLFQECPTAGSRTLYTGDGSSIEELLCVAGQQLSDYMPLLVLLGLALLNRAFFAIITFGMKVPSGLVLPSMSIGALFGRIVGSYMEYLTRASSGTSFFAQCPADSRCVIPGVYALVGAGATLTGATHTTIAVVAILMELTGNLIYTLPVLVGVMTARWVTQYFSSNGIYDLLLEHAGHPYFDMKTQYIHTRRTAAELMQLDIEAICVDYEGENTIALLSERLERISARGLADGGFPVLNARGHLLGWIACAELEFAIARCNKLDPNTVCFFNNPLWQASYVAHDPTAIPHFCTPIDFAKAKSRQGDNSGFQGGSHSTETTASSRVNQTCVSPLSQLHQQWHPMRWRSTILSNDAAIAAVADSMPLLGTAEGVTQPPSYRSGEQTAMHRTSVGSPSASRSNKYGSNGNIDDDVSDEQLGLTSCLSISPKMTQAHITTIPYYQDRPNDFTPFVDQTPLTLSTNSPIELVANLLGRLGMSYLCIVDKGVYCGTIFKKAYIGYTKELEESGFTC
ncbi:hypothetical protein GGF37_001352 [Kickxella alabastrina]|nr:hypothetical protein GGF37_001352 [Kickxella alabastrina]